MRALCGRNCRGNVPGQAGIHPAVGQVCLLSRRADLFPKLAASLGERVAEATARKRASEVVYLEGDIFQLNFEILNKTDLEQAVSPEQLPNGKSLALK